MLQDKGGGKTAFSWSEKGGASSAPIEPVSMPPAILAQELQKNTSPRACERGRDPQLTVCKDPAVRAEAPPS